MRINEIGRAGNVAEFSEDRKTLKVHGYNWKVEGMRVFNYEGSSRMVVTVKKPRGRRYYSIVVYENGTASTAV